MPKALQRRSFFGWMAAVPATLAATRVASAAEPLARDLVRLQEPAPPAPSEKDLKDLQDMLKMLREAKLPQAVPPAFTFAALRRARKGGRR
ncbi:MAG TPA: hypothetical protein VJ600_06270 [Holophagaceae bacterium]|nr:hypothetical protein [Holophagaceae bacterium]